MFEEIAGLPLHPLAVHAAVVFVPLLVLASLVYALVPKLRAHVGWAAVGLAVVAPIAAVVARQSGEAFLERRQLPLDEGLTDHRDFGTITMWVTIALGVLTLALYLTRRAGGDSTARTWAAGALTVLVVVTAVAAGVYVLLTGDAGSRHLWEPLWPDA